MLNMLNIQIQYIYSIFRFLHLSFDDAYSTSITTHAAMIQTFLIKYQHELQHEHQHEYELNMNNAQSHVMSKKKFFRYHFFYK